MLNKNERDGKIEQVKGRVQQAVGDLTDNPKLKAEGKLHVAAGKVQEVVGNIGHKTGDAVKDLGAALKH